MNDIPIVLDDIALLAKCRRNIYNDLSNGMDAVANIVDLIQNRHVEMDPCPRFYHITTNHIKILRHILYAFTQGEQVRC